jgi:transcriptional regulator with XRE-family HTH domain
MFKIDTERAQMEQKDRYTLRELFDNLEITFTELKKRSGISDVTLGNIRKGQSARQVTINTLLRVFSEIYGIKLSQNNVDGIIIQGKPVTNTRIIPTSAALTYEPEVIQKRPSRRKSDTAERELPEGCILAHHFAGMYGVSPMTFRDHYIKGLGPKDAKEKAPASHRPKPSREKELEWYLTPEQQADALDYWKRHGVPYHLVTDKAVEEE